LDKPMHGQRLLVGFDQPEAAQPRHRLVEGERVAGQHCQLLGHRVERLGEQVAWDLLGT
jgi:hypothetical protein